MNKFRVGDIVRGTSCKYVYTNNYMTKGKVINVWERGMTVKILEHSKYNGQIGENFDVLQKYFEPIDEILAYAYSKNIE